MASTEILLAFLVTTAVFAYMPGPAMLYATAQTLARGRLAGLMATLGIHIGGYVHVLAAAAGLSVLFHAVPPLYLAVKIAGALYLAWLGLMLIRNAGRPAEGEAPAARTSSARKAFLESVTVEVLNPKTAVFFLAFLPQFVDPGAAFPVWAQFLILGTAVNAMFSSADLACVVFAASLRSRLARSGRAQRLARRTGGAILIGLGAHLALQRG
jgi:threonine/homoserine/homoserine lactone efflux protein